jgi:hypothetical protein
MSTHDPDDRPGDVMKSWDADVVAAWQDHGFDAQTAVAWLEAAPGRFTQWTARQWIDEGFGPRDAALWSDVFACPVRARERRQAGYGDPFDLDQ